VNSLTFLHLVGNPTRPQYILEFVIQLGMISMPISRASKLCFPVIGYELVILRKEDEEISCYQGYVHQSSTILIFHDTIFPSRERILVRTVIWPSILISMLKRKLFFRLGGTYPEIFAPLSPLYPEK